MDPFQQKGYSGKSAKGDAIMKDAALMCSKGQKMNVEFNAIGQVIKIGRSKYKSYIRNVGMHQSTN